MVLKWSFEGRKEIQQVILQQDTLYINYINRPLVHLVLTGSGSLVSPAERKGLSILLNRGAGDRFWDHSHAKQVFYFWHSLLMTELQVFSFTQSRTVLNWSSKHVYTTWIYFFFQTHKIGIILISILKSLF